MSTSGDTLRWPQRARRSTIQAGVAALVSTPRTMRPEKRPHSSGASTLTGSLSASAAATGGIAGRLQRRAGQRGELARDAVDAEPVREVGRELEGEQRIVELQHLAHVGADRRIGREFEQAAVVVAELELARRAQHALALDAAQLAELDEEGLAVVARRQLGADQRQRHLDADARVGRAAHDVEQGALPRVDLAHAQAIGVGMLHRFLDLADHDLGEGRRHRPALFDLEAAHRERLGQFGAGKRRVAELAQPGLWKLHLVVLVLVYWNWLRKRRSPSKNRRRSFTP